MTTGRLRAVAAAAGIAGAALFVWSVKAAGASAVVGAVQRLGIGFAAIIALGGIRHLLRATAWRTCLDDPRELSFGAAMAAYIAGDAAGNVTPFGMLISEPSKIVIVRRRVAAASAAPALAVENLFYGASVLAMLMAGTVALFRAFDVSPPLRAAGSATVAVAALAGVAAAWVLAGRRRIVSGAMEKVGRGAQATREAEDRVFGFVARHPGRVVPIVLLEIGYHAAAVFEIWLVLRLITGTPPAFLTAFVLEYVNRTITVAFQFVPMWLGVDEAGTGLMTSALGLTGATGVALALTRKARVAFWTAAGFVLLGIFRPGTVLTNGEHEDRHRWFERIPRTAAREGARR